MLDTKFVVGNVVCRLEINSKWLAKNDSDSQSICIVVEASVPPSASNRFGWMPSARVRAHYISSGRYSALFCVGIGSPTTIDWFRTKGFY